MTKQEIIDYMYENHVQGDFKIEEMAEDLAQPQWIPVSKRLPDLDKYVLCTVNDQGEGNEVVLMCLTTSIKADDYYWTDYACEYTWELCEVFAWMPLPEPYKEEQHD